MMPDAATDGVRTIPDGYWVTKDWAWEWGTIDKPDQPIGKEMSEAEAIAACRGHRAARGAIRHGCPMLLCDTGEDDGVEISDYDGWGLNTCTALEAISP